jgi:16S rRNA processing protein RimM
MNHDFYLIGKILGGHGIKGQIRFMYFGESINILKGYSNFYLEDASKISLTNIKHLKSQTYVANIDGINDRNGADNLKGVDIFIHKNQLPRKDDDDVFYNSDLMGCKVFGESGKYFGIIIDVANYGASDILNMEEFSVQFTKDAVLHIDIEKKIITVLDHFVI